MRYQIEVNEIVEAEAGTRDMAMFIARAIKDHWKNLNVGDGYRVVVYKEGETLCTID